MYFKDEVYLRLAFWRSDILAFACRNCRLTLHDFRSIVPACTIAWLIWRVGAITQTKSLLRHGVATGIRSYSLLLDPYYESVRVLLRQVERWSYKQWRNSNEETSNACGIT